MTNSNSLVTSPGPAAPGEFQKLITRRILRVWLRKEPLLVLFVCIILQSAWAQFGIPAVAASFPSGAWDTALIFFLFLLDPITACYVTYGARAQRHGLANWPTDPGLHLAGVPGIVLFRSLRLPFMGLIMGEMVLSMILNRIVGLYTGMGYGDAPLVVQGAQFGLLVLCFWPVSGIMALSVAAGNHMITRYLLAVVGFAPLLALIFTLESLTFWSGPGSGLSFATASPGYYLMAIPVVILYGQLVQLVGTFWIERLMRTGPQITC